MLQDPSSSWKTPRNTLIAICFSESVRRCVCVCVWGGGGVHVCVCVCVCVCCVVCMCVCCVCCVLCVCVCMVPRVKFKTDSDQVQPV